MTVSMSALSKFSTMKRPRWPGGTEGALGGAPGAGVGGTTVRGGSGRGGSGFWAAGGVTGAGGGVGAVAPGAGIGGIGGAEKRGGALEGAAHPLAKASTRTAAMLRFTSLLRRIRGPPLREASQEIGRQRPARGRDRARHAWLRLRDEPGLRRNDARGGDGRRRNHAGQRGHGSAGLDPAGSDPGGR